MVAFLLVMISVPEVFNRLYAAEVFPPPRNQVEVYMQASNMPNKITLANVTAFYEPKAARWGDLYVEYRVTVEGPMLGLDTIQAWVPANAQVATIRMQDRTLELNDAGIGHFAYDYTWETAETTTAEMYDLAIMEAQSSDAVVRMGILRYKIPFVYYSRQSVADAQMRLHWNTGLGTSALPDWTGGVKKVGLQVCRECVSKTATDPIGGDTDVIRISEVLFTDDGSAGAQVTNPFWAVFISAPAKWVFSTLIIGALLAPFIGRLLTPIKAEPLVPAPLAPRRRRPRPVKRQQGPSRKARTSRSKKGS
ncbi:hypothetical protein [Microlunatus aurantiacus]